MKTSTSRKSNVKHSTGNNETTSKNRRRRPQPKTSTGEKTGITHLTGRSFGPRREDESQEEKSTKQKPSRAA